MGCWRSGALPVQDGPTRAEPDPAGGDHANLRRSWCGDLGAVAEEPVQDDPHYPRSPEAEGFGVASGEWPMAR